MYLPYWTWFVWTNMYKWIKVWSTNKSIKHNLCILWPQYYVHPNADEPELTLSKVALNNRDRFSNLYMIVSMYLLINPQNMEVERGFSETDAILSKRRALMDHETYATLKTIKSVYNKGNVLSKAREHWPLVRPHIETAAKNYSIAKSARKKEETRRRTSTETS